MANMELHSYVGYTCDSCGHSWEQPMLSVAPTPKCPECSLPVQQPDLQIVLGAEDIENGVYECYACGHTFAYTAAPNENPNDTPNCTYCTSANTGLIY